MSKPPPDRTRLFQAIYDAELAWLLRTFRRLGARPEDVEDLAHDTFCTFYRRLDSFDSTRPARPWLYGIAVRTLADHRRRAETRQTRPSDELDVLAGDHATPEDDLENARKRALVLASLDTLSDDQRTVLVAHDLDGLSIPELSEVLGVTLNTLYSRLRLARQHFAAAAERLLQTGAGR